MKLAEIAALAIALGTDAFSVGVGVGTMGNTPRRIFRLSFHFGLFQFFMPLLGWGLGTHVFRFLKPFAPWIAGGMLVAIGTRMLFESFRESPSPSKAKDPTRGWALVGLSIATSLDALGVGMGLSLTRVAMFLPCTIIGLTAFAMTWAGMEIGEHGLGKLGQKAERVGAILMISVGVKMILWH